MEVVIEKAGGRVVVRLLGRFDIKSTLVFRNAVRPLLADSEVGGMTVDFDGVPFIDSTALGMLLLLREQATAVKKDVVLSRCGPTLQRVLSVAQFPRIFRME